MRSGAPEPYPVTIRTPAKSSGPAGACCARRSNGASARTTLAGRAGAMHGRLSVFVARGETGALMQAHDWAATPVGPPEAWPSSLKTLVDVMLGANQPRFVAWGPEHTLLYNGKYAELLA